MFIETGVNELNTLYHSTGLIRGQVYRIINSGNLEPNALTVKFGDFVKWDGSKWVTTATKLATTDDVNGVVDEWIKRRGGGGGHYYPDEDEPRYFPGSILVYDDKIIRITSQAQKDDDDNIYYNYQNSDITSELWRIQKQGLIDCGEYTEADISEGTFTILSANSHSGITLETVEALTVLSNAGLGDFELLIDNSGNTNDVAITVKSADGQTTYLHSSAAGTDVAAGKIAQLTCVGTCWTLAEFEAPTP